MPDKPGKPHPQQTNREARLARALRANLPKRKAATTADRTSDEVVAAKKPDPQQS